MTRMVKVIWLLLAANSVSQCVASAADATVLASTVESTVANAVAHGKTAQKTEDAAELEQSKKTGAGMLLGTIAFAVVIYYLVNSRHKEIPQHTWTMVSTSVSIFVAVMVYNLSKNIILLATKQPTSWELDDHGSHGHESHANVTAVTESHAVAAAHHRRLSGHGPVTPAAVLDAGVTLAIWWLVFTVLLYLDRRSKLRLSAWGTIGGHVLGFAAIDFYGGGVAQLASFNEGGPGMLFLVLVIYVITVPIMIIPIKFLVSCAEQAIGETEEDQERIEEQCTDTAIDFFCMGAGFLVSLFFRSVIVYPRTGQNTGFHANSKKHPPHEVWSLIAIGLVFVLLAGCLRAAHIKCQGMMKNVMNVISTTMGMSAAWCLLDASSWHWNHRFTSKLMAHLAIALSWSSVFLICVLLLGVCLTSANKSLKSHLKGDFTAVSMAVGLSWEHLFDIALEDVAENENKKQQSYVIAFTTFVMVLLVYPAWAVYMNVQHNEKLKKEYKGKDLAPWNACCGDEDEEEDEEDDQEGGLE